MWALSSLTRDRTRISTLEDGFLTTGTPGKSLYPLLKLGYWSYQLGYCRTVYFSLQFCQFLLYLFGSFLLGSCRFIIVLFSCWIKTFISIYCPYVSCNFFDLESILSDNNIATSALFWLLFAWNIFFHSFTFNLFVLLYLKWVSCKQHIDGSNLYPETKIQI